MKNALHTLIDAARIGEWLINIEKISVAKQSLYLGRSEESLSAYAPYLFQFETNTSLPKFYFENGWGHSWGIHIMSNASFDDLFKHFRKFLIVKTEEGKELYFRFYDPRVLRIFLPTCDGDQLKDFFGPVKQFIVEDENPDFAIRFWLENATLRSEKFTCSELFENEEQHFNPQVGSRNSIKPEKRNEWID